MSRTSQMTVSSGNIFADIGLLDAEERQAKSTEAIAIHRIIQRQGWPTVAVAAHLGLTEENLDDILHGDFDTFSVEQLAKFTENLSHTAKILRYFSQPTEGYREPHVSRNTSSSDKKSKSFVDLPRGTRLHFK